MKQTRSRLNHAVLISRLLTSTIGLAALETDTGTGTVTGIGTAGHMRLAALGWSS